MSTHRTVPCASCSDVRCDLHNRFVFGGRFISYDTTENGTRQIALVPVTALDF